MEIEPIPSIDGAAISPALDTPLVEYLRHAHAAPAQIALAEAQAEAVETTEQRAEGGDHLAQLQLARNEERDSLVQPAHHAPPPVEHRPGDHGVHEPGKGDVIDIYD